MIGDVRKVIILPHIQIQNANARSSPITIGFPAMSAWLGAVHALQRKINIQGLPHAQFYNVGVVSHNMELRTYQGPNDYVNSIIGTANPIIIKGNKEEKPPFIEEAYCHLDVSLAIEYAGVSKQEEQMLIDQINHQLHAVMKIAGGDIIAFNQPRRLRIEEGNDEDLRRLIRDLMPGFALIERRELMVEAMEQGQDTIDALLDYLAIHHHCDQDEEGNVTWMSQRKTAGWIVPIATGFHGITCLGRAKNQRDPNLPHRFAESLVTLGEFRMPHRIQSLDDILWHYETDLENHLYLCRQ